MAAQVIPFIYNDKPVRSVMRGDEPWFAGKDVCAVLDIRDHRQALERLDADERGRCNIPTPMGEQEMVIISEAGVFRLVFTSRRPEAEAFKRWLAHEVLPQLRRTGRYAVPAAAPEPVTSAEPLRAVEVKLRMVQVAQALHGLGYARKVWAEQGLTAIMPVVDPGPDADARNCLWHLLDCDAGHDGHDVASLIEQAFEDDMTAQAVLRPMGLRVLIEAGQDWLFVANDAPFLRLAFEGTPWAEGWKRVLARLPDAKQGGPMKIGQRAMRGVLLPGRYLDRALLRAP
jgi:prophage antirepressor-like protein